MHNLPPYSATYIVATYLGQIKTEISLTPEMILVFTWAPACASNKRCPRTVAEKQTGLSRGQCFPPAKFLTICHLVIEITWARAPLAIPPHGFLALAKLSKVTLEPACSLTSLLGFGQKLVVILCCYGTWQQ